MGWHKLGNRIVSDAEMHKASGEFLDVAVPSIVTGIGVWLLTCLLQNYHFFIVHTTTTKLIYVVLGFTIFMFSYAYRMLIVALAVMAFFGMILFIAGAAFLGWLLGK